MAAHDLSAGSRLGPDDIRSVEMPLVFTPPAAVASADGAIGQVTDGPVASGEVLVTTRLAASAFGPSVAPGNVVVTVGFASVPAGLSTADRVDAFATYAGARPYTTLVGEDLHILSIAAGTAAFDGPDATSVTLDVDPETARQLLQAAATATLGLAARAPVTETSSVSASPTPGVMPRPRVDSRPVTILQAIILGIVQGITEFAPISSSGHLILVPWALGWNIVNDPALNKTFDVALHMGTLLGAVIYFRTDLWSYLKAFVGSCRARAIRTTDERLAWAIVIGTIPGVIVGATLESVIEDKLGQPVIIAVMLAVMGVILYVVDRVARQDRGLDSIGPRTGTVRRDRTGARAAAGGLALRHHDHGGEADRSRSSHGRTLLVPDGAADHRGGGRAQGARPGADRVPGLRPAVPRGVHRRGDQRIPRDLVPAAVSAHATTSSSSCSTGWRSRPWRSGWS